MSYALNENELVVNLKTGYDVRRVFIHHGDPFEAGILGGNEKWTGTREEIVFKKRSAIRSGGPQPFSRLTKDASIILNSIRKRRSGITVKTVF